MGTKEAGVVSECMKDCIRLGRDRGQDAALGHSSLYKMDRGQGTQGDLKEAVVKVGIEDKVMSSWKDALSLNSKPSCHTRSKACSTSRNATVQYCLSLREEAMTSTTRRHWRIVEWSDLNPNWRSGITFWDPRIGWRRLKKSFSNISSLQGGGQ